MTLTQPQRIGRTLSLMLRSRGWGAHALAGELGTTAGYVQLLWDGRASATQAQLELLRALARGER